MRAYGLAALVAVAAGCAGGGREGEGGAGPRASNGEVPVAVIADRAVTWEMLRGALGEGYGGPALEDLALDMMLERELARAGVAVGEADVEAERRAFLEAVGGPDAAMVLEEVRSSRGLGPVRFGAMLRRNAALRGLVQDRVEVTEEMIERRFRVKHGEKVRARIIAVPSAVEAGEMAAELWGLEAGARRIRFADLAIEKSTDVSSAAGGLLEPISVEDPAYGAGVRRALSAQRVGEIGEVLALEGGGFGILMVEGRVPAEAVGLDEVRGALRAELRARQERLLMDELAVELLSQCDIVVLDPALRWSWERFSARGR